MSAACRSARIYVHVYFTGIRVGISVYVERFGKMYTTGTLGN
jgi:hypothetical protein